MMLVQSVSSRSSGSSIAHRLDCVYAEPRQCSRCFLARDALDLADSLLIIRGHVTRRGYERCCKVRNGDSESV